MQFFDEVQERIEVRELRLRGVWLLYGHPEGWTYGITNMEVAKKRDSPMGPQRPAGEQ